MSEIETYSLLFDSAWYLATYQDVTLANCDPLEHYLTFGYKEGRNPNRFFNTHFYLTTYPDVLSCHLNPFVHYILYGASEGRLPRAPHQAPLPAITFEIFLQDEDNEDQSIPTEVLSNTKVESEKPTTETSSSIENVNEKVIEDKPAPKPKKTVRKPTPQTKATTLTQKRKKAVKA